jgi:aspartate kinase
MKFGGTSVGSAAAIQQVVERIQATAREHQVVVVVSAMNSPDLRTTNALIDAANAAAKGDSCVATNVIPRLLAMHMDVAQELVSPTEWTALETQLQEILTYITDLSRSIAVLGELTPRALDLISGQGERCNARLIAAAVRNVGLPAAAIDATELIVTDNHYTDASPLMDETIPKSRERLLPLLEAGKIPIVTGFIGASREGIQTTLGRGGSDYSCSILGAALDADEVWYWKEVDGVMSADPRIVPEAHTLPELSYTEMAELSYYGANVLHPRTVYPLVQRGIPIRMLNTFNPTHPGTRISAETTTAMVKAISAIKDASLIRVGGPGMLGTRGIAARIFSAVAHSAANILLITQASSEQNICLAVPHNECAGAVRQLRQELVKDLSLHDVEHVAVTEPVMIVAVVGSGMRGTPGIAGKVFRALGDEQINIIAIAQGSTEYNISLVVDANDGERAVQAIHRVFTLG